AQTGNVAGHGMIANRNNGSRVLHFKDADSHARYNAKYGEQSLVNVLMGHVNRLSRDIALVERLGPNAERNFKYFNDRAYQDALRSDPEKKARIDYNKKFNEALFKEVSGQNAPVDIRVARAGSAFRNFMTAVKLPKVAITALSDEAGMMATSMANRVPYSAAFLRELKTLNMADKSD